MIDWRGWVMCLILDREMTVSFSFVPDRQMLAAEVRVVERRDKGGVTL